VYVCGFMLNKHSTTVHLCKEHVGLTNKKHKKFSIRVTMVKNESF